MVHPYNYCNFQLIYFRFSVNMYLVFRKRFVSFTRCSLSGHFTVFSCFDWRTERVGGKIEDIKTLLQVRIEHTDLIQIFLLYVYK